MVGLSDAWSGVIQDTASTCTLLALICAREKGGQIVYVSAHSHSSVLSGLSCLFLRSRTMRPRHRSFGNASSLHSRNLAGRHGNPWDYAPLHRHLHERRDQGVLEIELAASDPS